MGRSAVGRLQGATLVPRWPLLFRCSLRQLPASSSSGTILSILPGLARHSTVWWPLLHVLLSSASENYADENLMAEGKT